jgi:hypothetical protein
MVAPFVVGVRLPVFLVVMHVKLLRLATPVVVARLPCTVRHLALG